MGRKSTAKFTRLIIAEKRSVAASIASALGVTSRADGFYEGNNLLVSWCVGHLVSPMDAAGYDPSFRKWHFEDLPILPEPFRYVLAPGKEAAFENLRVLMHRPDVDTIVNACDAGREGELIFRLVYEIAGCCKPVRRLWISSMEDNAIREGFSDLRPGADYEALYQSALCRQKADWLVGINATRLFSVLYHRTLNVGRVQTPTLAMLVERERKISQFQKEKYYVLRLEVNGTENALREHMPSAYRVNNFQNGIDVNAKRQEGRLLLMSWIFSILMLVAMQIIWVRLAAYVQSCAPMLKILFQVGGSRRQLFKLIPVWLGAASAVILPYLIAIPWIKVQADRHFIVSDPVLCTYAVIAVFTIMIYLLPVKYTLHRILENKK